METATRRGKAAEGCHTPKRKRSSTIEENLLRLAILALALLSLAATTAHACGPFFPNNLLDRGDEALLSAPVADFARELERLNLAPSRFAAVPATNSYDAQTFDAEMADLTAALKQAKVSPEESVRIVDGHRVNREKLQKFQNDFDAWEAPGGWLDNGGNHHEHNGPRPTWPDFADVPGLPDEFTDYFAGACAFHSPDASDNEAREAWERLLARPAAERKYKSTWAAFMLGRTSEQSDDDKAVEYFKQTRDLAKHGFADSLGLASAAIGLEARVELRRKHFKRALELYLEQYATGDGSAVQSLRIAAQQAVSEEGEALPILAASPNLRTVITAYLISDGKIVDYPTGELPVVTPVTKWLSAVEAAGVKDVDSAERFALAAYQAGEFEMAQRWMNRARNSPVAMWLQAKLWLRAGKTQPAAALLAKVTTLLPIITDAESTNSNQFADNLSMAPGSAGLDENSARKHLLGELGVLRLSRGEFTPALDALLTAGFWTDAAYVAERVLTTDELKDYVKRNWPAEEAIPAKPTSEQPDTETPPPTPIRENIRYLLARRLTRESRSGEAREYFPVAWQERFDELVGALNAGWNEKLPADQRAQALFAAAKIARTNGMELLGTELAPDWHIHDGDFDEGLTWQERATNSPAAEVNVASKAELQRASLPKADPEARFHYRYQAAFLGWEAAKLMPDNADETARVLCMAGTWLKRRDPETADMFYKALVRRCRQTAIGAQADGMRWFPVLDAAGNPKPYRSRLEAMTPPGLAMPDNGENVYPEFPQPGKEFIIQRGDSILAIANAVSRLGRPLTPKEIWDANPNLDPARLIIGQKIFIPVVGAQRETEEANAGPDNEK